MLQVKSWMVSAVVLLPIIVIACFFPMTISIIILMLLGKCWHTRSSPVYKMSVALAEKSEKVTELLGQPLRKGLLATGNRLITAKGTMATMTIPLSGPQKKASLFVVAHKNDEDWQLETLKLRCRGSNQNIDLLAN